ncbi:MAG: hypothetical protein RBR15_10830 [Sphaerochaeta sp.]|nr:hypothetical protein [Sphaerochaeta sp.]
MKQRTKKALFILLVLLVILYLCVVTAQMFSYAQNTAIPNIALIFDMYIQSIGNQYRNLAQEIQKDRIIDAWLQKPTLTQEELVAYLQVLSHRYSLEHASLIEDATLTYYGTDKILPLSSDEQARDGWYFSYRDRAKPSLYNNFFYIEKQQDGPLTIFINIPHVDEEGAFLGLSGGGFVHESFEKDLSQLEQLSKVHFYLVQHNDLVYANPLYGAEHTQDFITRIHQESIMQAFERNKHLWYGFSLDRKVTGGVYRAKYIPEWDCYAITGKTNKMVGLQILKAMLPSIIILLSFLAILYGVLFTHRDSPLHTPEDHLLSEFAKMQTHLEHILGMHAQSIDGVADSNAGAGDIHSYTQELCASLSLILTKDLTREFCNPILSMKRSLLLSLPAKLKMPIDIDMRLCSTSDLTVYTNKALFEKLMEVVAITTYFQHEGSKIVIQANAEKKHPTIKFIATENTDATSHHDEYHSIFTYLFSKINITYSAIPLAKESSPSCSFELQFSGEA